MTPPAATAAARRADPRALRRTGPAAPRRVAGPARGGRAAPAARPAAARTRLTAAPGLTRPSHARARRAATTGGSGFAVGSGAGVLSLPGRGLRSAVRTLPDAGGLPDRLLRSRAWIGVVAGLLIGLVFLQVTLLKANAGIGQSVQASTSLESKNAVLRSQIAALSEDTRVTQNADRLGMQMPAPAAVRYLRPNGGVGGAAGATLAADASATGDAVTDDAAATDDTSGYADDGSTSSDDGSTGGGAVAADDGSGDTSGDPAATDDASTDAGSSTDDTATADAGAGDPESGGAVAPSDG